MVQKVLHSVTRVSADQRATGVTDYVVIAGMIAVIIAAILFAFGGSVTAAGV